MAKDTNEKNHIPNRFKRFYMKHTIESINANKLEKCKLTALGYADDFITNDNKRIRRILCKCSCGNLTTVLIYGLIKGQKSCGCSRKEANTLFKRKYSITNIDIYNVYCKMIGRCYNHTNNVFKYYGALGVTVCDEWKIDYQKFLDWALENGYKKGLFLDKDIKGNGKLYSPETCSFVTRSENNNHKKNCRYFNYKGKLTSVADIARDLKVKYYIAYDRLTSMPLEEAISI